MRKSRKELLVKFDSYEYGIVNKVDFEESEREGFFNGKLVKFVHTLEDLQYQNKGIVLKMLHSVPNGYGWTEFVTTTDRTGLEYKTDNFLEALDNYIRNEYLCTIFDKLEDNELNEINKPVIIHNPVIVEFY